MATSNNEKPFYSASLGGVAIYCQSVEDVIKKAIVKQEIPYQDGGNTKDMGQKTPGITLRCCFSDETYPNHAELLNLARSQELLELVHPVYGIKNVRIEEITVKHDDAPRTAEVDITLAVDGVYTTVVRPWQDVEFHTEGNVILSVDEQKESVLDQIRELGNDGTAYCEAAISTLDAYMTEVSNPANTLVALIDYGTDLPGRFVKSAAAVMERYAIAYAALKDAPATFMRSVLEASDELAAALGKFSGPAKAAGAARLGLEAAAIFSTDDQARNSADAAESAGGFDVEGNRLSTTGTTATLNSNDIEDVLSVANTAIQSALVADRGQTALKRISADLCAAALTLKMSAENVKKVRITEPLPIHKICLMYKLPYSAAPRILALNPQIMDPNRITGEIAIYAA